MKYWHIIIIFIVGTMALIVGSFFKIMHWPGAVSTMLLGTISQVFALLLLAIKIVRNRNGGSFLNK